MKTISLAILTGLALAGSCFGQPAILPDETEIEFTASSGQTVTAYQGAFLVPENRNDPGTRTIEIGYIRFPATTDNPGSPIVYLAGGPGGSGTGTARGPRFPLFMEMRQHGDVYAFDQRGTGLSANGIPVCTSSVPDPQASPVTDTEWTSRHLQAARECAAFWDDEGIDLRGYTTMESVRDLEALRQHAGASQLSLWGISYGSHLALAAIGEMDEQLDRVIIASAEGLDQTVKLPEYTAAYFQRLQDAVDSQPAAAAAYPDILALMNRVHDQLEQRPLQLEIPQEDGSTRGFLLQRHHLQWFAGGLLADPERAPVMLQLYASLDAGNATIATALIQRFVPLTDHISLRAMPLAMDRASGITPERLARFNETVAESPVGLYLNAPMPQLLDFMPEIDLGDEFRAGPSGDTPVLLLTGTLDSRTYIEEQAQSVAGLDNVTQVIVRNAGHNLFMTSPAVADRMHQFMRGEAVDADEITIDLPDFTASPFSR
ncbi:alpha/beta fold hydrolase [Hyphobacterium sp. HN65]|uniref:Proline iminopeptidase n=1 Tax=Hyphobacterium lacteum TaxID=3116575 RepID=A0ABU7LN45_9PROT|nr:alpha/beta fold hydrolase [Hyphobacterium sp. HN65]MEE2524744.1 alpha/beta fold hydrolase [Hyphobacterium sp. HN65]